MPIQLNPALRPIAAFGLEDAPTVRFDRAAWATIAPSLSRQRLTGLAAAALVRGGLELHPDDEADLARRDREVQAQALRAERRTLELVRELTDRGIESIVLKGPGQAHRYYADPALRPFIDVDLLVPAGSLADVVDLCEQGGATRSMPELRPRFDRRFAKSVALADRHRSDIDLHRTLAIGPLAHLVDVQDLWREPDSIEVAGQALPVLPRDLAFLHACLHAVATTLMPRWLAVRDVVATWPGVDAARGREIARRWAATGVVVAAVERVRDYGFPVPADLASWSGELEPTARERRVAATYRDDTTSARSLTLASWRYVRGARGKVAYARALLLPAAANRAARHRSRADQVRRLLRRST